MNKLAIKEIGPKGKADKIAVFIEGLLIPVTKDGNIKLNNKIEIIDDKENNHLTYLREMIEQERGHRVRGSFILVDLEEPKEILSPWYGLVIGWDLCTSSRIISGGECEAITSLFIDEIGKDKPSYTMFGNFDSTLQYGLSGVSPTVLKTEDFEKLQKIFKSVSNVRGPDTFNPIRNALSQLDQNLRQSTPYDIISSTFVGLESIMMGEGEESISYKVSLRTAYLIRDDKQERKKVFRFLKEGYHIRSAYVHGSDVVKKAEKIMKKLGYDNLQSIREYSRQVEDYLREALEVICKDEINLEIFNNQNNNKKVEWLDNKILGVEH